LQTLLGKSQNQIASKDHESDCLNPSSCDDLSYDSGKDPGCHVQMIPNCTIQSNLLMITSFCSRTLITSSIGVTSGRCLSTQLAKCHVMSIGNFSMLCDYTMNLGNHTISITRVQEECDLGVLFSSNLKFDKHISNTVRKANNLIGIIKRTFSCLDQCMF